MFAALSTILSASILYIVMHMHDIYIYIYTIYIYTLIYTYGWLIYYSYMTVSLMFAHLGNKYEKTKRAPLEVAAARDELIPCPAMKRCKVDAGDDSLESPE